MRVPALALVAALAAAGLVGCATQSRIVEDSAIAIGVGVPFTGVEPSAPDATLADLAVAAATLSGFSFVDETGASVPDPSFGTATLVSEQPLVVRYTVADGLRWSDGAPVDAVDLLLDWAARGPAFPGAGFGAAPDPGLDGARGAELSADRKSLTVTFDADADWGAAFRAPLPAHAAAERALVIDDPEAAKDAVIDAVGAAEHGDSRALAALASAWTSLLDPALGGAPSSGPYVLDSADADAVVLAANEAYRGERDPVFARYEIRTIADPTATIQALEIGRVQAVQLAWNKPLEDALRRIGADVAVLPPGDAPSVLIGWFRHGVRGFAPKADGAGILWNPWAWEPVTAEGL